MSSSQRGNKHPKQQYKDLIEDGVGVGDTIDTADVMDTFNKIMDIINTADDLISKAGCDFVKDAQVLKLSHDLLGTTTEKIGNCDFREEEFVKCLQDCFQTDEDFGKFISMAVDSCRTSGFAVPLIGTFSYSAPTKPEKEQKDRQIGSRQSDAQMKAPENIDKISRSDQGANKLKVVGSEIKRICKEHKTYQFPYYKLICDPTSFMKSVDMAFQISFFIRDGTLGLTTIDNEPFVNVRPDKLLVQLRNREGKVQRKRQCVMSIDPIKWRQKVEQFNLRQPFIKLNQEDQNEGKRHGSDLSF